MHPIHSPNMFQHGFRGEVLSPTVFRLVIGNLAVNQSKLVYPNTNPTGMLHVVSPTQQYLHQQNWNTSRLIYSGLTLLTVQAVERKKQLLHQKRVGWLI